MKPKALILILTSLTLLSVCVKAVALDDGTRAAARTLVSEGVAHYRANRYDEARQRFVEAYAVAKVPTVAVWAGQAHEQLGKWVAAAEYYESALLMQPNELWVGGAQQQAQKQAQELLKELKPRLPGVKIVLTGTNTSEVEVTIDAMRVQNAIFSVERPLDPGIHQIAATRAGRTATVTVTLAVGEKKTVTLEAPAAEPQQLPLSSVKAAHASEPQTLESSKPAGKGALLNGLGWASLSVGAAGLVVGGVAAALVGAKRSELHSDGCTGNVCNGASFSSRVDSYNTWRTVSTAGFIVGGLGLGLGIPFLLASPRAESNTQLGVVVGPNAVGLNGAF